MGGMAPQNYNLNPMQGFDQGLQTADALQTNLIGALKLREEMSNAGVKDAQNLYAKQEAPYNYLASAADATKKFLPINPQRINSLVGSEGNSVRNIALQMAVEFAHSPEETAKKYPMADIIQNPLINKDEVKRVYENIKIPAKQNRNPQSDLGASNDQGSMSDALPLSASNPKPIPIDQLLLNDNSGGSAPPSPRGVSGSFADPASAFKFAAQVQPQDLISPEEEKIIGQAYGMQAGQIKSGLASIARMSGINENDLTKMMIAQASNQTKGSEKTMDELLKLLGLTIAANKTAPGGHKGPKELSDQQIQNMVKQAGDDAKKSLGVMGQFASDRDPGYQSALAAQYEAMDNAKAKQKFYTLHKKAIDDFYSKQPNSQNKAITPPPAAPTQQAAPKEVTKYINSQPVKFRFNPQTNKYDPVK